MRVVLSFEHEILNFDWVYTSRYREKKITTAEFKAVARRATHELYKGMAVVGSKEWIDQEGQIVRSTLRDLRASKVQ